MRKMSGFHLKLNVLVLSLKNNFVKGPCAYEG